MGVRTIAVLLVATTLLEIGLACSYDKSFEYIVTDAQEAQDITNVYVPSEFEGYQIDMKESTKNELIIRVFTNITGYSPLITSTAVDVSVNINGLLAAIPSDTPSASSQVTASLYMTGLLQALAYKRDDMRSLLPAAGASLLFANLIGVRAQESCPWVLMEITLPRLRCFEETDEGFLVNDCPLAPTGPTARPTNEPTLFPTTSPTLFPTTSPQLAIPTFSPTPTPTEHPTVSPTRDPTLSPTTSSPTTSSPTESPTPEPTISCAVYSETNDCETRPDCYQAFFSDAYFDAITASVAIDPNIQAFLIDLLNVSCIERFSLTDQLNCLFLSPVSCNKAKLDGYCGDEDLFQLGAFQHLADYEAPEFNCFPVTDLQQCDGITDETTCFGTNESYIGQIRSCVWFENDSAGYECIHPNIFNGSECERASTAYCNLLFPICSDATGSCKINCEGLADETSCLAGGETCQWLTNGGGSFCTSTLRFSADMCTGLTSGSCNAARTVNSFLTFENSTRACTYDTTCEPRELLDMLALDDDGNLTCHPPHTTLELQSGPVAIKDISVGDFVKSAGGYEPITAIIHADMGVTGRYYRLHTKSSFVDISRGHLIKVNGVLSDPAQVKLGDVVDTVWGEELVTSITMNRFKGAYHIYTRSGSYYADGILVSDQHGLTSWNWITNSIFSLWKSFTSLRYSLGMPIVNDNKVVWFGAVMRAIDTLPLMAKIPAGLVAGSLGFVYGNIVTTEPTALAAVIIAGALLRGNLRK